MCSWAGVPDFFAAILGLAFYGCNFIFLFCFVGVASEAIFLSTFSNPPTFALAEAGSCWSGLFSDRLSRDQARNLS